MEAMLEMRENMHQLVTFLRRFDKPTIAAVNGAAIAGGTGFATMCDFTLAVPEAKFGYTEVQNFHLTLIGEHDVFRLDVAVNDAMLVGGHQRFGALDGDGEEFVQRQTMAQTLAQVLAFNKFQN